MNPVRRGSGPNSTANEHLLRVMLVLPVLVFLGLRLAVLATAIDRLGHLGEGELEHASLAADIEEDRPLRPIWTYQVVPFHGGTLLSTLLFVPWSKLFGVHYWALKGLAMAYALGAMLLWMWLLERWQGWVAAAVFGWLYACAPPVLLRMQLTLWSTHAELSFFLALCLVLAQKALSAPLEIQRRGLFWTGLAAGLAVFFNLSALVFLALFLPAIAMGMWLRRSTEGEGEAEQHPVRGWMALAGGIALGLVPLGLTVLLGQGELAVYNQGPGGLLEGAAQRLLLLPRWLVQVPPFSPQIPPPSQPDVLDFFSIVLHLCVLMCPLILALHAARASSSIRALSAIRALRSTRALRAVRALWPGRVFGWIRALRSTRAFRSVRVLRSTGALHPTGALQSTQVSQELGAGAIEPSLALTVFLYPFVFLVVFSAVHLPFTTSTAGVFGFCPRYVATLYPFLFAALALITAGAIQARPARAIAIVTTLALVGPGLLDDIKLIDPSSPGMGLRFHAIRYVRADLWGVDRRSMAGVEKFLDLEARGEVPESVARGVRAIMGPAWNTDFWHFLSRPPDGPAQEQVDGRVREALKQEEGDGYRRGVIWGKELALGAEVENYSDGDDPSPLP